MTFAERMARPVAVGLVWVALFSVLYSAGDEIGAWPKLPVGAFQNLDLAVGFLAGLTLLVVLAIRNRQAGAEN